MKKLLYLFIALASIHLGMAQNTITVVGDTAGYAQALDLSVTLDNTDDIAALQFDVVFDPSALTVTGSAVLDPAINNHAIGSSQPESGRLRIVIFSLSGDVIAAGSQNLLTVPITTKYEPGSFNLSVENIVMSDALSAPLTGNGVAGVLLVEGPKYVLVSQNIDFGEVPMLSTPTQSMTVQNQGNTTLTLSAYSVNLPPYLTDQFPIDIPAFGSTQLTVALETTAKQIVSEQLSLTTNDPSALRSTQRATISADIFAVNEITIGSGSGPINTNVSIPVTVDNMEPFNGFQFDVVLPQDISYVDGSVAYSGRETDHVVAASMINSNTLRILGYSNNNEDFTGNSGALLAFELLPAVSSGTYPLIIQNAILTHIDFGNIVSDVYSGQISISSPNLVVSPSSIDFGRVPINQIEQAQIDLTNNGSLDLLIDEVVYNDPALTSSITPPLTIAISETTQETITFTPASFGLFSSSVSIRHNGSTGQNVIPVTADVFSPNYLLIEERNAYPGQSVLVDLSGSFYEDIRGMQFDINIPGDFTFDFQNVIEEAALANFTVSSASLGNNDYRFIIYTLSNDLIANGTVPLLKLPIEVDPGAFGDYTLAISNVVLSNASNQNIASEALEEGVVHVVENLPPTAADQSVQTPEDTPIQITLIGADVYNDPLTYTIVTQPANGTAILTGNTVDYTPDANYNGPDSFTFTANDGTTDSNVATVSIDVTAVNDAPVASDQSVSTYENVMVQVTLEATDVDGDLLTYALVTQPINGTAVLTGDSVDYTPDANYNGIDIFTFTANDGTTNGNIATITVDVMIDTTAPVITLLGDNPETIELGSTYTDPGATAIDNVDGDLTASIVVSGSVDPSTLGSYTLNYDVSDSSGNAATTASRTVNVIDTTAPNAVCQDLVVQLDAWGNATITAEEIDNGSSDNDSVASLSLDTTTFTCVDLGANTVTLTVTDTSGNSSTCTATVTVEDNIAPSVLTQDITVDLDAMGTASITPAEVDNGSTDNCNIDTYSLDVNTFDCDDVGLNTVTLTVVDVNGNSAQATAVVTVVNPTPTSAPLSGGDQSECALSPLQTLTATANVNAGESLFWYDAATGGNAVADPSLNTIGSVTYYAEAVNDLSSCVSLSRTAVTLEILALPIPVIINNTGVTQLDCNVTSINLTASGGDSYLWSNGETTATIDVTTPGTYSVTVTGANGCEDVTSIVITQDVSLPVPVITNNTGTTELNCNVTTINLTASGGDSYLWSTGETTATIDVTTPNTYSVTVTGTNGCSDVTSVVITQDITLPIPVITNNTGVTQLDCNVTSINLTASGGDSYLWSNGETTATIDVTTPNTYSVTVTGTNGCEDTTSLIITQDNNPPGTPTSGGNQSECALDPIQTLTATATVGAGETLVWYDAATGGNIVTDPSLSSLGNVTYYAESINDLNGCVSVLRAPVTLEIIDTPQAPISGGNITEIAQNPIQTITAAASVGSGESLTWFDSALGGNIVSNPIWNEVGSITYYAESINDVTQCVSLTRTAVQLTLTSTCSDGILNGLEEGIDCGGSCPPCLPELIQGSYFESGWDGWIDGGIDCERVFGPEAYEGDYSIRLRANSGLESSMILENVDIIDYTTIGIEFHFYAKDFENTEDFVVEYSDGGTYQIIASFVKGDDFENDEFNDIYLVMSRDDYSFSSTASWRIRSSASDITDEVFIDQVIITGNPDSEILAIGDSSQFDQWLLVNPNPARDYLSVRTSIEGDLTYTIYNLFGQVINTGNYNGIEIPVYDLSTGAYLLEISNGAQKSQRKFIKE